MSCTSLAPRGTKGSATGLCHCTGLNPIAPGGTFAIWRSRRFPALLAVAISGAAFALLHPERPVSVLVFAALAAIAYLRVGIAASLAFHVAYNLGNYLLLLAASQANGA